MALSQSAIVTGTVTDQFGSLPGAKIAVEGSTLSTSTDVNGNFVLNMEPGSYNIKASFVMYVTNDQFVSVNEGDSVHLDFLLEYGSSIDQQISIGSRSKPRSLLETTVPVEVISPQDISNSSQIELSQILHYLIPSFHSTPQTIADGTDHIDPATLRGLGPDQLLVLVNGKRRHSSSLLNVNGTMGRGTVGTDFNAIPVAAIDRIEILRDGAAAQYGSDAIAGVVNIILKDQTSVINVDSRFGVSEMGDGESSYIASNFGFNVGERGVVNLTAEFRDRGAVNRSGDYTGTVFSADPIVEAERLQATDFFNQTGYGGKQIMEIGQSANRNLSVFLNAEIPLSKVASFYAHGGRNFRESKARGFYRLPSQRERVVLPLYPNGFSPEIQTEIVDNSLTLGIRGLQNNWLLDFSNSLGNNEFDFNVNNSNNASLGTASPNTFYAGGFRYGLNTTNIDISRTLNELSGINVAFGAELRIENYQIISGEEASWVNGQDTLFSEVDTVVRAAGSQVFPGFQPTNALDKSRTNFAVYGDVETNVTDQLLLGVAGRYEEYSDFGGQGIWKVSARHRISESVSVNTGYSTGFRAPSLHQVYFNNISTQFVGNSAVEVGTFNNESAVTKAFNIDDLKPELSSHFSMSTTARLSDQLALTVGYYYVGIRDRIVLSGRFGEGYEDRLGPLNVRAAQFFTNAIDSRTQGIDGRLDYNDKIGKGNLRVSLAAHLTQTQLNGAIRTPLALEGQEETLFNREEISRVESVQPNFKVISLAAYKFGRLTLDFSNTLFGRVKYIHPSDGNSADWVVNDLTGEVESRDQTFSPKLVTDMKATLQLNDNFRVSIGGNNIFNVYPDRHNHSSNINNGLFQYSRRVQQFGVKGAYYFARVLLIL